MAKAKTTPRNPLVNVRATVSRLQGQAERMVGRLRRDAEGLITRSRTEVMKEVRDLERWLLKGLHAATEDRVAKLEQRLAKLEEAVAALRKDTREQAA